MLAIVTGHLWTTEPWVRPVFFTWHVPIFFFLAGYLWNEHRSLAAEIRHRALTVLLPFAAWILVLTLVVNHDHLASSLRDVAHQAWDGNGFVRPFWAFWFALALFFAAVLYRVVSPLPWLVRTALVLGTTTTVSLAASAGHQLPLDLGQGAVCTTWILAGHALRRTGRLAQHHWGEWHDLRSYRAAIGSVLLVCAALGIAASRPGLDLDLHTLDLGVPVVSVLLSVLICTGLVLVASALPGSAVPAITTDLARAGLVVMLVHLAVIDQIGGFSHRSVGELVVVAAAAWGIGLVLLGVPKAWWLTGQRTRAPQTPKTLRRFPQPASAYAE
jgi:acyltransferase